MINKRSLLTGAFLALLIASCGVKNPPLHVPGHPDDLNHVYDSVVMLVHTSQGQLRGPDCTATFVSRRLLATAAHCVPAQITINVGGGTLTLPAPEGTSPVGRSVQFVTHQDYNQWLADRGDSGPSRPVVRTAFVVQHDDVDNHDVALLEIAADEPDAVDWLKMRNLRRNPLAVGEEMFSVGMPVGQTWILTNGIVSRVETRPSGAIDILHQVRIGPGSSGSALIDGRGRIVAVNSAVWGGIGFGGVLGQAKPISYIQTMIEALKTQRENDELSRSLEERE